MALKILFSTKVSLVESRLQRHVAMEFVGGHRAFFYLKGWFLWAIKTLQPWLRDSLMGENESALQTFRSLQERNTWFFVIILFY